MIWKRWTREYLPQMNQRSKWSKEYVRNLKEGELLWLVDEYRCDYKFGRIIEIFTGNDGVVRSARVKMAHGELNRPVVKLAPVYYDGVCEIENRAGDVGATSNQLRKPSDSKKSLLKLKKLEICQNSKMVETEKFYKLGPKICTPPDFVNEKPEQHEVMADDYLYATLRVTSTLLMIPTNAIASDPQVWLLALIWCKIGIFRYFVIYWQTS